MASIEARYLSLLRSKGLKAASAQIPGKGVQRDIFSILLSAAENGKASDPDVFKLSLLIRRHLEANSSSLSGKSIGILRRRGLFSAFTGLVSAADASLASCSFAPIVSHKRLVFSCVSGVRDRDARVFLERSFSDVFAIPASKPLRDPSFYLAMDRILGSLPVNMSRVSFRDLVHIFILAFLLNCMVLFSLHGAAFDESVRVLALLNLTFIFSGVSDLMRQKPADAMPGIYARLDILVSKGLEPNVLDVLMKDVLAKLNVSKDLVGWSKSVISLLNEYKRKNPSKEAGEVVEKWVKLLDSHKKAA